jgi:copper transport protein
MVFLHALGLALWVGALPILYEHYRYADGRGHLVLTRFSNLALPIVGIALSAGLVISWIQLGEVASLWTTAYGRILLVKLTIVSIILALAALNRWLLTPRLTQNDMGAARALRRTILGESIGVMLVMARVSGWRFTPPPSSPIGRPKRAHPRAYSF